jgi:hypothetical protein
MLKNLKSLFVITEEKQSDQPAQTQQVKDKQTAGEPASKAAAPNPIDNSILDRLIKAIEDNNQPGFDYLEYRRSLKSLAALPMEESIKFQSAFATASTMDVTLEKLLDSIEFYKKVLLNEKDNFFKASKQQYTQNVDGRIKEKQTVSDLIKEKSLAIQNLTEEIRAHQVQLEELNKLVGTAEEKIRQTSESFTQALQFLMLQMEQDGEKLKQYIK